MRSYIDRGYIVVMQDVRGRFMSEGEFVHVRPAGYGETDETTDSS
ncbi:MAG: CocE/NonD family hydrolase [Alistipes finegoldii]